MEHFHPATQAWFTAAFAEPTTAQAGAWNALAEEKNALVVAPTGSGKTLAAFLAALDRLAFGPPPSEPKRRCRVLYVSPLKALAVDVERNLRAPLAGLKQAAARLGLPEPDVDIAVRSGDTPADQRRKFMTKPSDILITTPESLFLLLTSAARESLRGVETVIIDEVHAVAGTKRGSHLAVSLERLDALLERPARRIGLSATVRPAETVAQFLGGPHPVQIVAPQDRQELRHPGVGPGRGHGRAGHRRRRAGRRRPDRSAAGVGVAARRGGGGGPDRAAPLDHRLHQLPAAGRAADRQAERGALGAGHRRSARRRSASSCLDEPLSAQAGSLGRHLRPPRRR